jgi:galactokinase
MRHLDTILMPAGWTVVVASSGVGSHKTGTERSAYNRLAAGATALLELWNAHERPAGSLAAAIASSGAALGRLHRLAERATVPDWPAAALRRRLDHLAREDERVRAAMSALRSSDAAGLGRLAAESQSDSERLLRNQVLETSALVQLASGGGAIASRSFGAGFGGSVWAVVHNRDAARFLEQWLSAYRAAWPEAATRAVGFVSNPGPPVTRLDG